MFRGGFTIARSGCGSSHHNVSTDGAGPNAGIAWGFVDAFRACRGEITLS